MDEATLESVMQRLSHVERQVRWWKGLGLFAVPLLGMMVLMGATNGKEAGVAEEIRARRFVVIDGNEKPRVVLGKSKYDDSEIVLLAKDGSVRAELSLLPAYGSPALALYDKESRRRVYLGINDSLPSDSVELQLIGKEGSRIDLSTWSQEMRGPAYVSFGNNQVSGSIGVNGRSAALQFAYRETGKLAIDMEKGIAELRLDSGSPSLTLADKQIGYPGVMLGHMTLGNPRTDIQEKRPASSLVLLNKEGKVLWSAP